VTAITSAKAHVSACCDPADAPEPSGDIKGEIVMVEPVTFVHCAVVLKVAAFVLVLVALGLPALGVALFGSKQGRSSAAE
jgi:hypothetical protein